MLAGTVWIENEQFDLDSSRKLLIEPKLMLEWFKCLIAAHCFIENSYINLKMEDYLIILGSAKRPHSASDPFIKVKRAVL